MALLALAACSKGSTSSDGKVIHADDLSTTVPGIGKVCSNDSECSSTGGDACKWACVGPKSNGKSTCALFTKNAGVGSTGCYGNSKSDTIVFMVPREGTAKRGVYCDLDHGARCDAKTRTCVAVAKIGEACTASDDCGPSGDCKGGKCIARAAVGASCKDVHCVPDAKCDSSGTCVARGAKGAKCVDNDGCLSAYCLGGTCGDKSPATATCSL
jgi:hypothetical protein